MGYRIMLFIHVVAVVLFLGGFITAWLAWVAASRSMRLDHIAHLFELVELGDRWLTPVPVVVIIATGIVLASSARLPVLSTPWILGSLLSLAVSGLVFGGRLIGLQRALASVDSGGFTGVDAKRLLRSWARWAGLGSIAVVLALTLMILKPVV